MKTGPDFTVVIPSYNRPVTTLRAVRSVLDQTYPYLNVVLVDDGSTDETVDVVSQVDDSRLRIIKQSNCGAPAARNRGAMGAVSEYLTFLDSDDVVDAQWLEMLAYAAVHAARPPLILTCGFRSVGDADGQVRVTLPGPVACWPRVRGYFGHAGTFAIRTSLFAAIGGYAPALPANQHTELAHRFLRIVDPADITVVDRPLMSYHVGNPDNIRGNDIAVASGTAWMLREHADLFASHRRPRADLQAATGVRFIRAGRVRDGRSYLWSSYASEPWRLRRLAMALVSMLPVLATRIWSPSRA